MAENLLKGQNILVTGASSGIGRACASLFAQQGATVAIVGRNAETLKQTEAFLSGDRHKSFIFDISDSDPRELLQDVSNALGPLNGMLCGAGLHSAKPLRSLKRDDLQQLFNVNVFGVAELLGAFPKFADKAALSSVVALSSIAATSGQAGIAAYSASKGALESLVRSAAAELSNKRVRVNAVAAGLVRSPMTENLAALMGQDSWERLCAEYPLGIGEPEDVAHACSYLLSHNSKWVTGSVITLDGGYALAK